MAWREPVARGEHRCGTPDAQTQPHGAKGTEPAPRAARGDWGVGREWGHDSRDAVTS